MGIRFYFYLVLFMWPYSKALASPILDLNQVQEGQYIGRSMHILGFDHAQDPEEVRRRFESGEGELSQSDRPNFGIKPGEFWLWLPIDNSHTNRDLFFENNFGLIDYFDIYQIHQGRMNLVYQGGDQQPFSQRTWLVRANNKRISFPVGRSYLLLRAKSDSTNLVAPRLWTEEGFRNLVIVETAVFAGLFGILFVMFLYNLFLALSLRDALYFSYIIFVAANIVFMASNYNLGQMICYHLFGWETYSSRIQLSSVDVIVCAAVIFSWKFLNLDSSRHRRFKPLAQLCIIFCIIDFFIIRSLSVWHSTLATLLVTSLAVPLFIILGILRLREGYRPALFYLVSWLSYLIGAVEISLVMLGFLDLNDFAYWGQFVGASIEVTLFSIALGSRFNYIRRINAEEIKKLNQQLRVINTDLESKVEERTQDIQDIMRNIKQGIFSVDENLHIGKDYSQHLKAIFEKESFEQTTILDLITDQTPLSSDQQAKIVSAFSSIIGQDPIAFDMNSHLLPHKLAYGFDKIKNLEFEWYQLVREGKTARLLGAVRDVTERNTLQREVDTKSRELNLISQLIEVEPERLSHFLNLSKEMLDECSEWIKGCQTTDTIRNRVLIHYHTLKGLARSLHFDDLSSAIHDAESVWANSVLLDRTLAQSSHDFIAEVWQTYAHINHDRLGRFIDPKLTRISKGTLLQMLGELSKLPLLHPNLARELSGMWRLFYKSPEEIVFHQFKPIKRICDQFEKPMPKFVFINNHFGLSPEASQAFELILNHLISNSLVHGFQIHSEENRDSDYQRCQITIEMIAEPDSIRILYTDNGRGISLSDIEARAKAQGLNLSQAEDPFEVLFLPGFTTQERANQLAGRGMGLESVRAIARQLSGNVKLLRSPSLSSSERVPVHFEIQFPRHHFRLLESLESVADLPFAS